MERAVITIKSFPGVIDHLTTVLSETKTVPEVERNFECEIFKESAASGKIQGIQFGCLRFGPEQFIYGLCSSVRGVSLNTLEVKDG
jgi:hypothetical protein